LHQPTRRTLPFLAEALVRPRKLLEFGHKRVYFGFLRLAKSLSFRVDSHLHQPTRRTLPFLAEALVRPRKLLEFGHKRVYFGFLRLAKSLSFRVDSHLHQPTRRTCLRVGFIPHTTLPAPPFLHRADSARPSTQNQLSRARLSLTSGVCERFLSIWCSSAGPWSPLLASPLSGPLSPAPVSPVTASQKRLYPGFFFLPLYLGVFAPGRSLIRFCRAPWKMLAPPWKARTQQP